jgi:hypothetical protein
MSTSDGVTRAALYWNLAPQDVRHDLARTHPAHHPLEPCRPGLEQGILRPG